jgi:hypothetical protein
MLIPVFRSLLLAVATVDVACRYCTLAIGGGNEKKGQAKINQVEVVEVLAWLRVSTLLRSTQATLSYRHRDHKACSL